MVLDEKNFSHRKFYGNNDEKTIKTITLSFEKKNGNILGKLSGKKANPNIISVQRYVEYFSARCTKNIPQLPTPHPETNRLEWINPSPTSFSHLSTSKAVQERLLEKLSATDHQQGDVITKLTIVHGF